MQGDLLQSLQTRFQYRSRNRLPHGEYIRRDRSDQPEKHVQIYRLTKKWNVFPVAEWNWMMALAFRRDLNLWTGELRLYDWKKNRKV